MSHLTKIQCESLKSVAQKLVQPYKGVLAADETHEYMASMFHNIGLQNTRENRLLYRLVIFTTKNVSKYISGVILNPETVLQCATTGETVPNLLNSLGILAGVNLDNGLVFLEGTHNETITSGLNDLNERCAHFKKLGCYFAKWRCAFKISHNTPSDFAIRENAITLARYSLICQNNGLVPIIEPDVSFEGKHDIKTSAQVLEDILSAVYAALIEHGVNLEATVLKTNMVLPGRDYLPKALPEEVGVKTWQLLSKIVPDQVPGIGFLSGGQTAEDALQNLNAICKIKNERAWNLTFIFGRALQEGVINVWNGENENITNAQALFFKRAHMASNACIGILNSQLIK